MFKLRLGAAAVMVACLPLVACGQGESGAPTFEPLEEPTAPRATSTVSSTATGKPTTSSSQSPTSSAQSSTPKSTSAAETPSSNHLVNDDGSFRLTNRKPGGGAAEELEVKFTDLEKQGFSEVQITLQNDYMNGFLQWVGKDQPGSTVPVMKLESRDLAGNRINPNCNFEVRFFNEAGEKILPAEDPQSSSCSSVLYAWVPPLGDLAMEISITQPGFEPLKIKQPIKAFK